MIGMDILAPAVGLMIWTMVMWVWMYATRLPAMQRAGLDTGEIETSNTASLLDQRLPSKVQWKAHNYNHLHEQPTVFYAICVVLAIIGAGDGMNAFLAWIYTGLRVIHSLVQVTANKVMVRFVLFAISSVVLIVLIASAATVVFGGAPELTGATVEPTAV